MPTEKRVTISDIAKEVGVSTTTVSRFLSGRYQYMSKSTREKIRTAVQKHGYRPSLVARGLKSSKSYLIGVIMPQVHKTVSSHSIRGVCMACTNSAYSPIIVSIENNIKSEGQKIQELLDHRVDGILTFTGSGDAHYQYALDSGIPVVRVDRLGESRNIDSVVINHYDIVQDTLLNLSVSGFSKIAIFSPASVAPYSTIHLRRRSYYDYAAANHFRPIEYTFNRHNTDSIRTALTQFIQDYPSERKAAVVLSVEDLASVNWVYQLMGLRYPEDLALLGYVLEDDTDAASAGLSVIEQPINEMCSMALSLVTDRIANGIPDTPEERMVPASLIIRKSTII